MGDDEGRRQAQRGRQTGVVLFAHHDDDQPDETASRQATDRTRKPNLMSFPSLEHLDRMADGSPWRSATRRRRRFRGGIGGLHRRRGETTDPPGDDVDDDVELERVTDVETVPDTSRRPARTASSVSRTASAAARQRERQLLANRGAQPPPSEPENRIYRPVKRPQPLPPPPLGPRQPAPVDREALRVADEPNSLAEEDTGEPAASRPRRQRRRRPRGEAEAVPQTSAEPAASVAVSARQPRVHQPQNGSHNVSRDMPTEIVVKPEPEVSRSGRRHTSRRAADPQAAGRTDTRKATFV